MNASTETLESPTDENPFITRNRNAVRRYLKAIVIADNEPVTNEGASAFNPKPSSSAQRKGPPRASLDANSHGDAHTRSVAPMASQPEPGEVVASSHALNIQDVTNAFSQKGMICGSYLPNKQTSDDIITNTLIGLVECADAAIIDWQIGSTAEASFKPTVDAIAAVLRSDDEKGERLRLIVIYTGEPDLDKIRDTLKESLKYSGISNFDLSQDGHYPVIECKRSRIVFCNKYNSATAHQSPVSSGRLQELVIEQFERLSRGVLRSYALSCIAAIREESSRLMAQYRPELDGAFVEQRASIPDPEDATEMMHDIMLSDVSAILRSPSLAEMLSADACIDWFASSGLTGVGDICERIQNGSSSGSAGKTKNKEGKNDFHIDEPSKIRSQKAMSSLSLYAQAHASSLLRPAFEAPTLSLGLFVYNMSQSRYAVCIIPRCDSVRLDRKTFNARAISDINEATSVKIPFIELFQEEDPNSKFLLTHPHDEAKSQYFTTKTNKLSRELFSIGFKPDATTQTIIASRDDAAWVFTDVDNNKWEWIGTLREMVAQNIVASVCNALNRVGLNEHEWLRKRKPF